VSGLGAGGLCSHLFIVLKRLIESRAEERGKNSFPLAICCLYSFKLTKLATSKFWKFTAFQLNTKSQVLALCNPPTNRRVQTNKQYQKLLEPSDS
jgi:hypothetical protein